MTQEYKYSWPYFRILARLTGVINHSKLLIVTVYYRYILIILDLHRCISTPIIDIMVILYYII